MIHGANGGEWVIKTKRGYLGPIMMGKPARSGEFTQHQTLAMRFYARNSALDVAWDLMKYEMFLPVKIVRLKKVHYLGEVVEKTK